MYDKVKEHFERGMDLFFKGQYKEALGEFTTAKSIFSCKTI